MGVGQLIPAHTTSDTANRITLPRYFSDRQPFCGTEPFQAWLLLLMPGRYRLLTDDQVKNDPRLEPVRLLITEGKVPTVAEATCAEEPERAATVVRLLPTTISPPPPGWRISFPKAFDPFVPPGCDARAFSVLFSLDGYWEIWYTDILRKSAIVPLSTNE
jgi:hypothetical protein